MVAHRWIYIHNLSPFLWRTSLAGHDFGVRWYGLAYVLSFMVGYWLLSRAAQRGEIQGLNEQRLERLVMALMAGVIVGGRLGFVLQNLSTWRADPLFPFKIAYGGMAFFGGLVGVLLAVFWAVWRYRLRFWEVTDALTFIAALGLGFGRLANFVNGELVGRPTNGDWGVIFPRVDMLPRHPSQLYESASHFVLWGALWLLVRRYPVWARGYSGRLSMVFLAVYGVGRFLTDFFRADDTYFGPFSSGQWASLVVALTGFVGLWVIENRRIIAKAEVVSDNSGQVIE